MTDPAEPKESAPRGERLASALAVIVLFAFTLLVLDVARRLSATHDEVAHVAAAYATVETGEVVLNLEHPPLVKLVSGVSLRAFGVQATSARPLFQERDRAGAAQWLAGDRLIFDDNPTFRLPFEPAGAASVLLAARLPLVAFALAVALGVYVWSRARHGPWGGLASLVLVATYPDLLGHGPLVATDVPLAAWALGAGWALDRLARGAGARALVAFGLCLGGALATKFTALLLLPAFALALVPVVRTPLDGSPASVAHPFGTGTPRERTRALLLGGALAFALALALVSACYLGSDPLRLYREGIAEATRHHPRPHEGYLFGEESHRWWWFYFPAIFVLRLPLGSLAALGLAAATGRRSGARPLARAGLASPVALVLVPGLAFFALVAALAPPLGSRYLLPAVPFFCVAAGGLATWARGSPGRVALVTALLGSSVFSAALAHPFGASLLNGLAGSPARQFRVDENEDWGGGFLDLARWQRAHRVASLDVVPFRAEATPVGQPPRLRLEFIPWQTHFAAYGVAGLLRGPDVLYAPEHGHVYAVSARALARALVHDEEWRRPGSVFGTSPPRLVLGGSVEPTDTVGGGAIVIFDLR